MCNTLCLSLDVVKLTCRPLCPVFLKYMCCLQAFVVGRLQDPKVEVRSLSAATLSGIIKALPAHEIDTLRQQMITQVQRLFTSHQSAAGSKRGRRSGGSSSRAGAMPVIAAAAAAGDGSLQEQAAAAAFQQQQGPVFLSEAQAVVQGLKAFVLSSPYDVPEWMPEVLMALVAAANSRNPLVRAQAVTRQGQGSAVVEYN